MTAPALVQKLWNYCNILPPSPRLRRTGRDDGLFYGDYLSSKIRLVVDLYDRARYDDHKNYYDKKNPLTRANKLGPPLT